MLNFAVFYSTCFLWFIFFPLSLLEIYFCVGTITMHKKSHIVVQFWTESVCWSFVFVLLDVDYWKLKETCNIDSNMHVHWQTQTGYTIPLNVSGQILMTF